MVTIGLSMEILFNKKGFKIYTGFSKHIFQKLTTSSILKITACF